MKGEICMSKLFIICGHGDGDSGACSEGSSEAYLVRQLASKLSSMSSDVVVGDTTRNWYKDKLVKAKASELKNYRVLELHMDSATPSAKGGHVIISDKFNADSDDTRLAKNISRYFPGRSQSIVKRGNLQNVNHAANYGVNYRLLECCFISNHNDRVKFMDNMDKVAELILDAFQIKKNEPANPDTNVTPLYRVQVGAYTYIENAEEMERKLKSMGFDACIVRVNGWYKVQTGAYKNRTNATAELKRLEEKGVKGFIQVVR